MCSNRYSWVALQRLGEVSIAFSLTTMGALQASLLRDVEESCTFFLQILVHVRREVPPAPSHQGSGNPKDGNTPSSCTLASLLCF